MGKGSAPRPFAVSNQEYSNRWDAIFGRDNEQKENKEKALEFDRSNRPCGSMSIDNTEADLGQAQVS
jgi:hypothetical protein